jgi:transcriptional regulator with XRE-family HTH domain
MGIVQGLPRSGTKEGPNPIDAHVGMRLRQRRTLIGMSQDTLAKHLNMSFQQVQKYESGGNRISASRLYTLTKILGVDVSYFFEGLPDNPHSQGGGENDVPRDAMQKRETIELVRAYMAIPRADVRAQLASLVRAVADVPPEEEDAGEDEHHLPESRVAVG